MEKFYSSKTLLKMADGRIGMHTPHPHPLDPPLLRCAKFSKGYAKIFTPLKDHFFGKFGKHL